MLVAYWLAITYVVLPILIGLITRKIERERLSPYLLSQVQARISSATRTKKAAAVVSTGLGIFVLLLGHRWAGGSLSLWVSAVLSVTIFLSTSALLYLRFQSTIKSLIEFRMSKFVLSVLIVSVAWISNVYADVLMISIAGDINPSDLPSAKAGILAIVGLMAWTAVVSLLAFIPYFLLALSPTFLISEKSLRAKSSLFLKLPQHAPKRPATVMIDLTLFVGLAFSIIAPLHVIDLTNRNGAFEPFLRNLVTFASFHAKQNTCAGPQPNGSRFAMIGYERVAVAVPDQELGYRFKLVKCPPSQRVERNPSKEKAQVALPTIQFPL